MVNEELIKVASLAHVNQAVAKGCYPEAITVEVHRVEVAEVDEMLTAHSGFPFPGVPVAARTPNSWGKTSRRGIASRLRVTLSCTQSTLGNIEHYRNFTSLTLKEL
jgi:hypothetical protein